MRIVKGMVQVRGTTYRIEHLGSDDYEIVRIADDFRVGTFKSFPACQITSAHVDTTLMREVARTAIRIARTSWVRRR